MKKQAGKMQPAEFSRIRRPEPEVTATRALVINLQRFFFLDKKQGIQLLLARFRIADLERGLHKVAYESKLRKGVL